MTNNQNIRINELEKEIKNSLENTGLISDVNFYKGNLKEENNLPGISYKIKPGNEEKVKELRKGIIKILHLNTSEGIKFNNNHNKKTKLYTDKLILDPSIKFNQEQESNFRYHILYHIKKEISNYFMQTHKNHHSRF
jgi:hypothetical protein